MDLGAMSVSVDDSSLGTKDENPIMQDHVNSKVLYSFHSIPTSAPIGVMEKLTLYASK